MEVALQWCSDGYSDNLVGFVNSVKTLDGGTHLDGLKAALTRTLNAVGRKARPCALQDKQLCLHAHTCRTLLPPQLLFEHVRVKAGANIAACGSYLGRLQLTAASSSLERFCACHRRSAVPCRRPRP